MSDLASPKLLIPAVLFTVLSPGVLLQIPTKIPGRDVNAFRTMKTDRLSILFHALVFVAVYKLVSMAFGLILTQADLVVPLVLFTLLSPGMLLSLPPGGEPGSTSMTNVLVHALVFSIIFALLRYKFPQFY
jgi:hypothetical protein